MAAAAVVLPFLTVQSGEDLVERVRIYQEGLIDEAQSSFRLNAPSSDSLVCQYEARLVLNHKEKRPVVPLNIEEMGNFLEEWNAWQDAELNKLRGLATYLQDCGYHPKPCVWLEPTTRTIPENVWVSYNVFSSDTLFDRVTIGFPKRELYGSISPA